MPKVIFTVQHEVEMDELNEADMRDMGWQLANGAKSNIESVVQSVKVVAVKALPIVEELDFTKESLPTLP